MDTDDLEPKRPVNKPKDLEELSIEALGEYVVELKAEIERVKAAIELKQAAKSGAEGFFKS